MENVEWVGGNDFIVGLRDKIGKTKNDFKGKGARWGQRRSEGRGLF